MQENRDGSFGNVKPFSEFMNQILKMDIEEMDNVKAFHFGTPAALNEIRMKKSLESRFDDLEKDVEELKEGKGFHSEYVVFPSSEEIKNFGSKGPMEKTMLKIMRGISAR